MKYLLFTVLLVAVILSAGCVQSEPAVSKVTPPPTSTECQYSTCNGVCYYNGSQKCCGSRLYDVNDGECCAGIMHDYRKDMGTCCGGKWYVYGTKGECCPYKLVYDDFTQNYEAVWINPTIQHCCGGKVVSGGKEISGSITWKECGDSCYNPITQSCCISYPLLERNETMGTYREIIPGSTVFSTVKEGFNSCCKDLSFQIPEDSKCNPNDGSITWKQTGGAIHCVPNGYCYEDIPRPKGY